ncbi:hypothetical protein NERG_01448 [Nematocida ausubeli]|uniref:Uncharacterized protein n=1 Tax=Nematocida ausubeli (strain ATCC PRA-371 / ERTm2) TaxID=1913371 RepID=H8ZCK5_NEMA1|nr:hypothetical protein NERG_01448 [Nematocida ausubeli]
MSKGKRQRVKYLLLAATGIIKLYLRASDVSKLSANQSIILECAECTMANSMDTSVAKNLKARDKNMLCDVAVPPAVESECNGHAYQRISVCAASDGFALEMHRSKRNVACVCVAEKKEEKNIPALEIDGRGEQTKGTCRRDREMGMLGDVESESKNQQDILAEKRTELKNKAPHIELDKQALEKAKENYRKGLAQLQIAESKKDSAAQLYHDRKRESRDMAWVLNGYIKTCPGRWKEVDSALNTTEEYYTRILARSNSEYEMLMKPAEPLLLALDVLESAMKEGRRTYKEQKSRLKEACKSRKCYAEYLALRVETQKKYRAVIEKEIAFFKSLHAKEKLLHSLRQAEPDDFEELGTVVRAHSKTVEYIDKVIRMKNKVWALQGRRVLKTAEIRDAYLAHCAAEEDYREQWAAVSMAQHALHREIEAAETHDRSTHAMQLEWLDARPSESFV